MPYVRTPWFIEAAAKLKPKANLVLAHRARVIARVREDKPAADVAPKPPMSAECGRGKPTNTLQNNAYPSRRRDARQQLLPTLGCQPSEQSSRSMCHLRGREAEALRDLAVCCSSLQLRQ